MSINLLLGKAHFSDLNIQATLGTKSSKIGNATGLVSNILTQHGLISALGHQIKSRLCMIG